MPTSISSRSTALNYELEKVDLTNMHLEYENNEQRVDFHIYVHPESHNGNGSNAEIKATLQRIEDKMSALLDAVERVVAAVGVLQGAFDAAVATDVADAAEIARLQAIVDAANADAAAAIAELANVIPAPADPPVEPPVIDPTPVV